MFDSPRLVRLPGHGTFWFLTDDGESGQLAPLSHVDGDGRLLEGLAFAAISYATVQPDGTIFRYGFIIGNREDLVDAYE